MHNLIQDLRFGTRLLLKNLPSTAVALLSLSLGIAATTAIFSVVYGVLIDPFPYKDTRHMWVVRIMNAKGRGGRGVNTISEYEEMAKLPVVEDALATGFGDVAVDAGAGPESIRGVRMSGNAFSFLGVKPLLGRTVSPQDIHPGGEPEHVVVLSYVQWRHLFGGDRNVLGKTLRIHDEPYTIIGVMPPRFTWFGRDSLWLPLDLDRNSKNVPWSDRQWVTVRLRLRPGVSQQTATQSLHRLFLNLAREFPKDFPKDGFRTELVPYMDTTVASGQLRTSLYILLSAVGLLLLIGCANVANLLLARATARQKEIAVRLSLGARRGRLIRQLLTESVMLALAGGALGVVLAFALLKSIVSLIPDFYIPNEAVISVNAPVLAFSTILSMCIGILFGLAPALHASKPDLNETLKDAGKGVPAGARGGGTRKTLVVLEIALSVMLLVGAGLTMRTFLALQSVSLGYDPNNLLYMDIAMDPKRYPEPEQRKNVVAEIISKLEALPGVDGVSAGNGGMPYGGPLSGFMIPGNTATPDRRIHVAFASDGYLKAMHIPLVRGRMFGEQEVARGDRVAIINQTAAAELWPNEDPVGRQISLDLLKNPPPFLAAPPSDGAVTIVGVIGDVRNEGLREAVKPGLVLPYTISAPPFRSIALRATDPQRLIHSIRQAVWSVDNDLPVTRFITAEESLAFETVAPRFTMLLFAVFAGIGLTLAAIGVYSVLSYTVSQRTHELGIRMALGAERGAVISLVVRSGMGLVAIGLAAGLTASFVMTRFIRAQLYGVTARDPVAYVGVAIVLIAISALACYVPARRASELDPAAALRHE